MAEIEEVKALLEQEFGAEAVTDLGGGEASTGEVAPHAGSRLEAIGNESADKPAPHPVPHRDKVTDAFKNRVVTTIDAPLLNSVGGGDGEDSQPQPPAPDYISKFSFERPKKKRGLRWNHLFDPDRPKPEPFATFFYDSAQWVFAYKGDIINLGADPGSGKSFLALDITRAMLSDTDNTVAGVRFQPGKVLWVDEEGSDELLVERLALLGLKMSDLEDRCHYLLNEGINLNLPEMRDDLFHEVMTFKPDLIVVDSRIRVSGVDENSNVDQARIYQEALAPLSRKFGATVILIHHTKKPGQWKPANVDHTLRGAVDITGQVDRNWILQTVDDSHFAWLHGKVRRGIKPPYKLKVWKGLKADGHFAHTFMGVIVDE